MVQTIFIPVAIFIVTDIQLVQSLWRTVRLRIGLSPMCILVREVVDLAECMLTFRNSFPTLNP